ncbi:thiol-disulfide oxidoreductase [Lysinibacillus alkalisoli]|uniref:Thiol-disulfide oxidoreductase n=1 Tax=Lysinibacillus alkalisoli TaxID=1911548 RepID=A0A917G849_9BACI|nr:DCC1-like thiol-disulfide oxidoreductase family protein [Lysinibacillus alkalisoli]GGG27489.1 thiol-disulfide oxidoreductase [Lysinibacillus alkalisoli]
MNVVLFDGDCHFCQASVQMILRYEKEPFYQFASLQSDTGQKLVHKHHIMDDSAVVIEGEHIWIKSQAALRIIKRSRYGIIPYYVGRLVPAFLADKIYDYIARNRHRIIVKQCHIPTKAERARILP